MTRPTRIKGGWEVRLRVGKGRRETFRLPEIDADLAQNRADRMERMRDLLVSAGKYKEVSELLADAARVAGDEPLFREDELIAEEIAGGKAIETMPLTPRTFRDVGDLWNSGELHKRYPHRVPSRKPETVAKDRARLEKLCATLGSIPISRVTEADCDRAIAALPPLRESTRAKYAQLLSYVLRLAVSPLKLIKATPLPEDWVPSGGERDEFQMLYPDEEAQLMRCPELTLERKYFWGLLARMGMRVEELERAVWGDVDLERGSWKVTGKNPRGGRPKVRRFGLSVDVWEALRAKKPDGALPGDPIVSFEADPRQAAELFRVDLADCGIDRRELHETTAAGRRIRAHDLRGTFVTLALAKGLSDQWIMDRTGHGQSQMLRVYDRDSRHAADRNLGWYEDLDVLLGVGRRVATAARKHRENEWLSESNADSSGEDTLPSQPETAAERQPRDAETVVRHPGAGGGRESWPSGEDPTAAPGTPKEGAPVASAGAPVDTTKTKGAEESTRHASPSPGVASAESKSSAPVEPLAAAIADLALSIRLAAQAGEWELAARLHTQLDRVTARAADVVSLDQRRKRNGDK